MPINITDEFHAATTKGKIASAKEVFLTGDTENLQQIGEKTHQLEDSIKNIAVTGGASTAAAVTFDNAISGMAAINAQAAIDELNTKNKTQDTEIAKKANSTDVNSKINEESTRVNAEIAKKIDKTSIAKEFGESEDKVISQSFLTRISNRFLHRLNSYNFILQDEKGNVIVDLSNGEINTKNFSSNKVVLNTDFEKLKELLNDYIDKINIEVYKKGRQNHFSLQDENGNVIMDINNGIIKTKLFNSDSAIVTSHNYDGRIIFTDDIGNGFLSLNNGNIVTKNFNSNDVRINSLRLDFLESISDNILPLIERKNTAAISWIDDDFDTDTEERKNKLIILKKMVEDNGIDMDIALIPDATYTNTERTDIKNVFIKEERLTLAKEFEMSGIQMLTHPVHYGLYGNVIKDEKYVKKNLYLSQQALFNNGFLGYNILVYPGSSIGTAGVYDTAKKYYDVGIMPGGNKEIVNIGANQDRYRLVRFSLDSISETNSVTKIKKDIDECISKNGWIIFITHVWVHTGDGTEPVDDTSNSLSNVFEIIKYANSKVKLRHTQEVWRERKILWEYYK